MVSFVHPGKNNMVSFVLHLVSVGSGRQRGTIDLIYTARQLQAECQEQNVDLYMTSVVLNKGFNIVSCDGLWKIMTKFGCHLRFIAMVQKFHDGMQAHVLKDFSD